MITSAQMFRNAQEEIDGFRAAIAEIQQKSEAGEISPNDAALNIADIETFITRIEGDMMEYSSVKKGGKEYIRLTKLDDIPRMVTLLRLYYGWSQDKLAEEIGVKQQQIARYETTNYEGISFQRMLALLEAFEADVVIDQIVLNASGEPRLHFELPSDVSEEQSKIRGSQIKKEGSLFKIAS